MHHKLLSDHLLQNLLENVGMILFLKLTTSYIYIFSFPSPKNIILYSVEVIVTKDIKQTSLILNCPVFFSSQWCSFLGIPHETVQYPPLGNP
jgi:hypothetical protein